VSVLDRKLRRDLRSTAGLLLAITSIMAVGVGAYVALGSAYRNLTQAQHAYYADCRMADFSIEVKKVPLVDLDSVSKLPGVVEIRPRIQFLATVDLPRTVEPLNGLVLSLPDRPAPVLNDILLRQGSYFTNTRDNEVIVNEAFARRHGLFPGQWIHLLLNKRREDLFIVGTAISSEFTYLVGPGAITPDPEHFGVFYIKRTFAEDVFDFEGAANQVLGRLAPNIRDNPREVLRRAELLLGTYGVFSTTPLADQPSHRFLDNEIQGLRSFGAVMPSIFLAVAAMVLNMLMSRLTEQQRVIVGTLKALGYDDLQVFAHFMKFGLAVGILGGVMGAFLGYLLAEGMTAMYRQFFEFPTLANRIHVDTWFKGLAISISCGLLGSFHGARSVLRLDPAESMRPKPPAQGGKIWLERFPWFWQQLSFGWRMTLRNVLRHRLRTTAGMFAAAMGASVSVNALMLSKSTNYLIDFQFQKIQRSDLDLGFKDERGFDSLLEARHLPGVDHAEPVLDVACTFVNGSHTRKGGITGLTPDARLTVPRDNEGRRVRIPRVGLTMSRKMAELMHLRRGDLVEIQPTKGLREPKRVPIVEINDTYLGLSVYADLDYLSGLIHEEWAASGVQLAVNPRPGIRETLYAELKQRPGLQSVTARADTIHNVVETLIKNQRVFLTLLVLFAGVIFFGSVLNVSLISLAEREREVATLRVLGYNEWQIGGLFLRESMITNVLGTICGLPLGYLLSVIVVASYDTDWFRLPIVDPREVWMWTLLLGLMFGLMAHACVQWRIFKFDWLDALKTKE
jgi:putative ABC transport system permease protein